MNEWITNRIPLRSDATDRKGLVWICIDGKTPHEEYYDEVFLGQAWMSIATPEPYVDLRRYVVVSDPCDRYCLYVKSAMFKDIIVATVRLAVNNRPYKENLRVAMEKAERIAAIYEEYINETT